MDERTAGELTSVGNVDAGGETISSLSVATAEAARVKVTPVQAASTSPQHRALVQNIMARADRFGYTMKDNEKVDLKEFDACVKAVREKAARNGSR